MCVRAVRICVCVKSMGKRQHSTRDVATQALD